MERTLQQVLLAGLMMSATAAGNAAERDEQRWVCVPTEDREWRCGRGAHAPDPAPLPPAEPPGRPPEGYSPRRDAAALPGYLRNPDPGPPNEAPETTATPETTGIPEAASEPGAVTVDDPPAGESREQPGAIAETGTEPVTTDADGAESSPAPETTAADAEYGIQITAARDPDSLEAYGRELELSGLDVYRRSWEDADGAWHVLMTGRFANVAAAREALNDLPDAIREAGAWIRPLDQLQPPPTEP